MKKNKKWKTLEIPLAFLWIIGLFCLMYGLGMKGRGVKTDQPFRAEYFIAGIFIVAPIYMYIRHIIDSEKGFPLENFNKELITQDIKQYKICGQVDLNNAVIESFVFGIGKDQNDYLNISYNKDGIEFVKTKITVEYTDGDSPITLTAFTNIDRITLKEIFQYQHSSTTVYFDKYIPGNYYLDLEFLQNWKKQN